mmetsp:Transcript_19639/g.48874  ORF Transcript_19639/g.48874 Transcript_19639/m.48874 type:complete len:377 (+) Transcript_19639:146-1276(+)
MFRPSMNESYRRNDSLANATWGCLEGRSTPVARQPLHTNSPRSNREESRILPQWAQEIHEQKNLNAATSLLKTTAIGNKNIDKNRRHEEQQSSNCIFVPKSPTSSLLDSLERQRRRERWLEMLPTRPQSTPSNLRYSNACRKFPTEDPKWKGRIQEVKAFVREHGHGRIPANYSQNQELARWCKRQRFHYKIYLKNQRTKLLCANSEYCEEGCHMTEKRLQDLNDAGFCFDLQVARWDRNYQLLKRSKSYPTHHKRKELQKWIEMQRFQMSLRKRGGKSFLNPERIQKLNDIGFPWHDTKKNTFLQQSPTLLEARELEIPQMDIPKGCFHLGPLSNNNSIPPLRDDSIPKEIVVVQPSNDDDLVQPTSTYDECTPS